MLFDTHVFLWAIADSRRLPEPIRRLTLDPTNHLFLSDISLIEIAIKLSLGKLHLKQPWLQVVLREMETNRFEPVAIDPKDADILSTLPFHHRDPFDRLIISQAIRLGVPVISADGAFDWYSIKRVWAERP
jgi:PIN domain nuclease of toxin-antitoxin system